MAGDGGGLGVDGVDAELRVGHVHVELPLAALAAGVAVILVNKAL